MIKKEYEVIVLIKKWCCNHSMLGEAKSYVKNVSLIFIHSTNCPTIKNSTMKYFLGYQMDPVHFKENGVNLDPNQELLELFVPP